MAKNEYLNVEKILGTINSLVQNGLRSPHAEPERALENMAFSLLALVSETHTGIARIRAVRNMRASGAARLSQEAITTIVLFLDRFEDRLTACQVCHLWRAVALEIPAPWPEICCTARANPVEVDRSQLVGQWYCRYCGGEVDGRFSVINSDLKRLALLRYVPGSAGLSIQLDLEANCKDPFTKSLAIPVLARDVRTRALQGLQSLSLTLTAGPVARETLSGAFSLKDDLFLDVLHPLVASAARISSLEINLAYENWLSILLCLPLMPKLRALTVAFRGERLLSPYDALQRVLITSEGPELPVSFPALRYLKVCDLYVSETKEEIPHITTGRILSLLRCTPELRYLQLSFAVWPHVEEPRPAGAPVRTTAAHSERAKLHSVVLGSGGSFHPGNVDCTSSFEEILNVLPIDDDGSLEYRALRWTSYDAVLSVLARGDFCPTSLSTIFVPGGPGMSMSRARLYIEATNASGGRRAAQVGAEDEWRWTRKLLATHLCTTHLASLTLNIAAWNLLADGMDMRTVKRLEIVIHASDLWVRTSLRTREVIAATVKFIPAVQPEHNMEMHLPALTTLAFGIHRSVWPKLRRDGIMDTHLNVPIAVLVADILTVSQSGTLVGNLVIGRGIRPTADAENPDADPIAELRNMAQRLIIV